MATKNCEIEAVRAAGFRSLGFLLTSLRLARALHEVGGFALPPGVHTLVVQFPQCILIALIILFMIKIKLNINQIQSIITSGYTMFLVTGPSKLLSQIALIFQIDVTREIATYSCPCVKTAFLRFNPTFFTVCP